MNGDLSRPRSRQFNPHPPDDTSPNHLIGIIGLPFTIRVAVDSFPLTLSTSFPSRLSMPFTFQCYWSATRPIQVTRKCQVAYLASQTHKSNDRMTVYLSLSGAKEILFLSQHPHMSDVSIDLQATYLRQAIWQLAVSL